MDTDKTRIKANKTKMKAIKTQIRAGKTLISPVFILLHRCSSVAKILCKPARREIYFNEK
jgi:hypothetical protein